MEIPPIYAIVRNGRSIFTVKRAKYHFLLPSPSPFAFEHPHAQKISLTAKHCYVYISRKSSNDDGGGD